MSTLFQKLFRPKTPAPVVPEPQPIIIVSGLPRSGTSLMMKMLEAGGLPVLTDRLRTADDDNPKGYYEYERVKALDKGDHAWLPQAEGKAVKVISALLVHLPPTYTYRIIFMQRNLDEVLASQRKMLAHRGEASTAASDDEVAPLFAKHVQATKSWLMVQPNMTLLEIDYNLLIANPSPSVHAIQRFLVSGLAVEQMVQAVDPTLYRNRSAQT